MLNDAQRARLAERGYYNDEDYNARITAIYEAGKDDDVSGIINELLSDRERYQQAILTSDSDFEEMSGKLDALRIDNARLMMRETASPNKPKEDEPPRTFDELWKKKGR